METTPLADYLQQHSAEAVAAGVGCSPFTVWAWRRGDRRPSPELARRLVAHSAGRLSLAAVRPDLWADMGQTGSGA